MSTLCENCGQHDMQVSSPKAVADDSSPRNLLRAGLEDVEQAILRHQQGHQAVLDTLKQKRRELQTKLGEIRYPVLTLPPEIVSRIFVACLPDHGRVRPFPRSAPLLLAQICHLWREIALSSCELWCSVDLAISRDCDGAGYTQLLETWFGRAKGRPLSLTIRSDHGGDLPTPFIPLIVSAAERLSTLEVQTSYGDFQLLRQSCAAFPRLRRLAVHQTTTPFIDHPLSIFKASLSLSDLYLAKSAESFSQHHPLLTSIELHYHPTLAMLSELFHDYPRLLQLKIHGSPRGTPPPTPSSHITTPRLQCLSLLEPDDLDNFTLPGLRRLEVSREDHYSSLLAFLTRSSCALEHLHLHFDGRASPLAACFRALPSLTSLSVRVDATYMTQFGEVFYTDPSLLPALVTLTFYAHYNYFSYLDFIHLLRARHGPLDAHLIFLDDGRHHIPDAAAAQFKELIAQGLKLRVTDNHGAFAWPDGCTIDVCESFP
ncbi:hypothetical protein DFH06DRAFT_1341925 [Mycena polygramma]|nr:hypothetical protein DFH06DRAFT_1341925 [Mycena polygramma]